MIHELTSGRLAASCDRCAAATAIAVDENALRALGWIEPVKTRGTSGRWWCPACAPFDGQPLVVPKRGGRR